MTDSSITMPKASIIVERIGAEQRELCPIPNNCHYMAHAGSSPLYTFGKSPNEARKRYGKEAAQS